MEQIRRRVRESAARLHDELHKQAGPPAAPQRHAALHGVPAVAAPVAPAGRAKSVVASRGVVFVHGLGTQRQSDALLDQGDPLAYWLLRWHGARPGGKGKFRIARTELGFATTDTGAEFVPAHTRLTMGTEDGGEETWVLTEAWWAASNRRQPFSRMVSWSARQLGRFSQSLVVSAWGRLLDREKDGASVGYGRRLLLVFYFIGVMAIYLAVAIIGYPLVLLALILAQLPIPWLQSFLLGLVGPLVEANIGELRAMMEGDIQAANMQRRVADTVCFLRDKYQCPRGSIIIIAHSGGAVVSYLMLSDPTYKEEALLVGKLITIGSGLNKVWDLAPERRHLQKAIQRHIHWVDIWATMDWAPAGWLKPPRDEQGNWAEVFDPNDRVITAQSLQKRADPDPYFKDGKTGKKIYWPEHVRATNELSVLTDHGAYWQNDEQVIARLAAEIDQTQYRNSRYWRTKAWSRRGKDNTWRLADEHILRRRKRVIWLTSLRMLAFLAWALLVLGVGVGATAWMRDALRRDDGGPIPGGLADALVAADGWLATPPSRVFPGWLGVLFATAVVWLPVLWSWIPLEQRAQSWLWRMAENLRPWFTGLALLGALLFPVRRFVEDDALRLLLWIGAGVLALVLFGVGYWGRNKAWSAYPVVAWTFGLLTLTALTGGLISLEAWARKVATELPFAHAWATCTESATDPARCETHPVYWLLAAFLLGLGVFVVYGLARWVWVTWDLAVRERTVVERAK